MVQSFPLLDIHQHAGDAILFFPFLPVILVSASLCSKEQSYCGNDSFPRSHLSTILRSVCLFSLEDQRTQNMDYIWQEAGLNSFLADAMLCMTVSQPEEWFRTVEEWDSIAAFHIFFATSLIFFKEYFLMWQKLLSLWWHWFYEKLIN